MKKRNLIIIGVFIIILAVAFYVWDLITTTEEEWIKEQMELDKCLSEAFEILEDELDKACQIRGLEKNCSLPHEVEESIQRLYQSKEKECVRKYSGGQPSFMDKLDECRSEIEKIYSQEWNEACKSRGMEENCTSLPGDVQEKIRRQRDERWLECQKKYPAPGGVPVP